MKIVFMGTPDFSLPSLKKINESKHNLVAVVTAPDKERGRGKQISPTPIKEYAVNNNLKVLTPVKLSDAEFIKELKIIEPDLIVVVAFRILPKEVYTIPRFGTFNLHGSLLPKFRGAAPIQWSLIKGEDKTGVTTFFLEDKVDTGNVILRREIEIEAKDNFGSLHDKMMLIGANTVMETIDLIETGNYLLEAQDNSQASSAPKITKELCKINFSDSVSNIHNLIRGLSPYPGAFFYISDNNYKAFESIYFDKNCDDLVREKIIIGADIQNVFINDLECQIIQTKNEIFIRNENGILQILEIQPEGRKRMKVAEFLRGYSLLK
jgi:methionyl-tRNA formyltransferase